MPYFQLFELIIKSVFATPDPLLTQTMAVLIGLYYDLTSPQSSRTAMRRCSPDLVISRNSWRGTSFKDVRRFLATRMRFTSRLDLTTQPDEPTPSLPSRIHTCFIEIAKVRTSTSLCLSIS